MRKIIVLFIVLFIIAIFVLGVLFFTNKKQESFDSTSNGILVSNNGNLTSFNTDKNSVLLIDSNGNLKNLGFPIGLVIPWAPALNITQAPNGWSLCDGTNGTPNLSNSFIIGASDTRVVGFADGEETVQLQLNHIPPHTHTIEIDNAEQNVPYGGSSYGAAYTTTDAVATQTTFYGNGEPHNNMPPYFVLKYLCYTGIQSTPTPSTNIVLISDTNGNINKYTTNNNSLIYTDSTGNMNNASFVEGMIMIYNQTTNIPSGWALCDGKIYGTYTVPDLRSRFILGESTGKPYGTLPGGEETVTLDTRHIPAHSHMANVVGTDQDSFADGTCNVGGDTITNDNSQNIRTSGTAGSGNSHNNMPPYYVLAYICYVGGIINSSNVNQSLIISDTSGNLNIFKTNNDSLVLTDVSGILKNLPFPKGLIIAWYNINSTDLPLGWSLCDGSVKNGYQTPPLQDTFIYGYDSRTTAARPIGVATDGEVNVTLDISTIPAHKHTINYYPVSPNTNCYGNGSTYKSRYTSQGLTDSGNVGNSGYADPHNNMPPFFALSYICYTGENL